MTWKTNAEGRDAREEREWKRVREKEEKKGHTRQVEEEEEEEGRIRGLYISKEGTFLFSDLMKHTERGVLIVLQFSHSFTIFLFIVLNPSLPLHLPFPSTYKLPPPSAYHSFC